MDGLSGLMADVVAAILAIGTLILITAVAIRWVYGKRLGDARNASLSPPADAEAPRLREEMKQLKDRLAVLERITVDKENSLEREIEQLRHS
jgi:hypothetical protein